MSRRSQGGGEPLPRSGTTNTTTVTLYQGTWYVIVSLGCSLHQWIIAASACYGYCCCCDGGRSTRTCRAGASSRGLNWERIQVSGFIYFIAAVVFNTRRTRFVGRSRQSRHITCEWRSASSRGSAALRALAIPAQSAPSTWANPSPDPSAESRA